MPDDAPTMRDPVEVTVAPTRALDDAAMHRLEKWLNDGERKRQARFRRKAKREEFAMAHGLLRLCLSDYFSRHFEFRRTPAEWNIALGPGGKPALCWPPEETKYSGPAPVDFSLSHTRGMVAVAVGAVELGVDVEDLGRRVDADGMAGRFFAPEERAALAAIPGPETRRQAFLRLWTLKEAYVKALGTGLAKSLASFAFENPWTRASGPFFDRSLALACDRDGNTPDKWHFASWTEPEGFAVAVAAQSRLDSSPCALVRRPPPAWLNGW